MNDEGIIDNFLFFFDFLHTRRELKKKKKKQNKRDAEQLISLKKIKKYL